MRYSLYEWVIMPMGFTNTPATFMQTMDNLFSATLDSCVAVFLDDILMYSHTVDKLFTLLEQILVCIHQYMIYCKLKKCRFLCNSAMLLGFDIMPKGMHISDLKV